MASTYSAGIVTAYGAAVRGGYTGTYEQFCQDQAGFAAAAQQVREDKESVEHTVQTFDETTVPAAVQSVTDEGTRQIGLVDNAGSTQVGNVNSAGTTQVGNVNQAGTTQVGLVQEEGATQVQAVEDKGEEVIESIPEDYSDLVDEVSDLNNAISEFDVLYPLNYTLAQGDILSNGAPQGSAGATYNKRVRTNFIEVNPVTGFVLDTPSGFKAKIYYYSTAAQTGFVSYMDFANYTKITNSPGKYIRVVYAKTDDTQDLAPSGITGEEIYSIGFTDKSLTSENKAADAKAVGDLIGGMKSVNRFDKNSSGIQSGTLSKNTGNITSGSGYNTSDFFEVSVIKTLTTSYVVVLCFYDSTKTFISGSGVQYSNYDTADNTKTVPNGAVYARISYKSASVDVVQAGDGVSRSDYASYNGLFSFDKLRLKGNQVSPVEPIIVAPSDGDYTSFTQAVYENIIKNCTIVVKPGTYDIVSEYEALFGQDVVDALADDTDLSGFQYGIRVLSKKIIFEPGSHLVCDWTGHTVNGTHRFSVFSIAADAELDGLDLDCTAVFYAIHDDYGSVSTPIYKIYRNCRITGHNIYNDNIIGGGCRPFAKYTIDNCYFDNGGSATSICVRYHNSNVAGSEPVLWISNCYFGQRLSFRWYGRQTTKMRVYVNNCTANSIYKGAEGSATNDNIELYKWNNEETGT